MSRERLRPDPDPERNWRIPPVPAHGSHSFAGAVLLDELSGPLGFALWQSFRDVQLWSMTPARERARLFAPGSAAARAVALDDPALRTPLRTLLEMVENPMAARPESVGGACAAISRWAEARGAPASALAFAEAAATASPDDAALAIAAGLQARQRSEHARAETWFLRAAGLGKRSGDWESCALAWLGMGKLQVQRGNLPRARRALLRTVRIARRVGSREFEALAFHNLFVVETEAGDLPAAEAWARDAYHAYPPGHEELPRLAHDLAYVWFIEGFFARAQSVFRAVLPHLAAPTARLFVLANLVRAAGAMSDREGFREAWTAAWALVESPGHEQQGGVSRALVDLARGAAALGEWDAAERAASRAVALATDRQEVKALFDAEALLQSVRSHSSPPEAAPLEPPTGSVEGDSLAQEIIAGLTTVHRA